MDKWLRNMVNLNTGKEKISSLFVEKKEVEKIRPLGKEEA